MKRPAAIDNSIEQDGKRIKVESKANMGYKSQLNEFCQKFHLAIPVYECKSDKRKGFSCTVLFNSKTYESHSRQPTKKQAEQNAAQVVLSVLNQCPPPAPNFQDYIEQCRQLSSQNTEADSTTTTAVIAASTSITGRSSCALIGSHRGYSPEDKLYKKDLLFRWCLRVHSSVLILEKEQMENSFVLSYL